MKNVTITMLLILLILSFSCSNKKIRDEQKPTVAKTKIVDKEIFYLKNYTEYGYLLKSDIGKEINRLDKSKYFKLNFATKVSVIDVTYKDEKEYVLAECEGIEKLWINRDCLSRGFVVINTNDSKTNFLPNSNSETSLKLQAGDLGYIFSNYNGYTNADFKLYVTDENNKKSYAGNRWVSDASYISNIDAAKQALYVYYAQINYERNNFKETNNFLDIAEKITNSYSFLNEKILNLRTKITISPSTGDVIE